jgi:hypothetical protein
VTAQCETGVRSVEELERCAGAELTTRTKYVGASVDEEPPSLLTDGAGLISV